MSALRRLQPYGERLAKALNVAEGTVRNDVAQNYAVGEKTAKQNKGAKNGSA
jgi:hypothetical protein